MSTIERRTHPLAMTTEGEIQAVREILTAEGLVTDTVRYAF